MALRNIRIIGDDILRKRSRSVEKIDGRILTLLKDMAETMYNTKIGAGLAAPQVGILKRVVFIMECKGRDFKERVIGNERIMQDSTN